MHWKDGGVDRAIQVHAEDVPVVRLGVHPLAWHDDFDTLERRHGHPARHFWLDTPFSRELFDETLELAFRDANGANPIREPTSISAIDPYFKGRRQEDDS
jgi:hypothetical protein